MSDYCPIAQNIEGVEECVQEFFQFSEEFRKKLVVDILSTNGTYNPFHIYDDPRLCAYKKLCPEDRCLVARHVKEGDRKYGMYFDLCRKPNTLRMHIAAIKEEYMRLSSLYPDEMLKADSYILTKSKETKMLEEWNEDPTTSIAAAKVQSCWRNHRRVYYKKQRIYEEEDDDCDRW
jgi:hypothetical protein